MLEILTRNLSSASYHGFQVWPELPASTVLISLRVQGETRETSVDVTGSVAADLAWVSQGGVLTTVEPVSSPVYHCASQATHLWHASQQYQRRLRLLASRCGDRGHGHLLPSPVRGPGKHDQQKHQIIIYCISRSMTLWPILITWTLWSKTLMATPLPHILPWTMHHFTDTDR